MLRKFLERFVSNRKLIPPFLFIVKVLLVYGAWKVFHTMASDETSLIHPYWNRFNDFVASNIIKQASYVLQSVFGYALTYNHRNILIDGTPGYYVADHCIGIAPCIIFAGFIFAYDGKFLNKLWYIPSGVLAIYLINVVRVIMLGFAQKEYGELFFELAHTSVYLLMSYGLFFILVAIWMNRFGDVQGE
jgi:exosortase/archaeosortase family protein